MKTDLEMRQLIVGTLVTITLTMIGCVGKDVYARVTVLEAHDTEHKVDNAAIKQDLGDFRKSFEDFKKDVQDDIARHHR